MSSHQHPLPHRYFALNKPYNMVSQFVSSHNVRLLTHLDFPFPEGTHALGRLDKMSEGLLLLTTNPAITKLLFQSETPHLRTYWVMVKGVVGEEALEALRAGPEIRVGDQEWYRSRPVAAERMDDPDFYEPWFEPKPFAPHSWLSITMNEGKFHQVRKMVETIRHRCIRLIRASIEDLHVGDLKPGCVREYSREAFFSLLKLQKDVTPVIPTTF